MALINNIIADTADKYMSYLYEDLTYKLRGIFFEVYNQYGPGFPEKFYLKTIVKRLKKLNILYQTEVIIDLHDEDELICRQRLDLVVDKKIIAEIKAVPRMHPLFFRQTLSYLKATKYRLALLVNFGSDKLTIKRYINEYGRYSGNRSSAKSA